MLRATICIPLDRMVESVIASASSRAVAGHRLTNRLTNRRFTESAKLSVTLCAFSTVRRASESTTDHSAPMRSPWIGPQERSEMNA